MKAKIKENKVYCPRCENHNYRIIEYKQIEEGTLICAKCRGCNREFEYLLEMDMTGASRFN